MSYLKEIDDPIGLVSHDCIDDDFEDNPTVDFIDQIQDIRYRLYALMLALDGCDGLTDTTESLLPEVITQLGEIARAEATWLDTPKNA